MRLAMMLQTEVFRFDPDIVGISCSGRFTLGNRLNETETLINSIVREGTRKLVLDLTHVEFLDSAGLGVIMHAHGKVEERGGQFRVAGPTEQVQRLLEVTHANRILTVDPDLVTSVNRLLGRSDAETAGAPSA